MNNIQDTQNMRRLSSKKYFILSATRIMQILEIIRDLNRNRITHQSDDQLDTILQN